MPKKSDLKDNMVAGNVTISADAQGNLSAVQAPEASITPANTPAKEPERIRTQRELEQEAGRRANALRLADEASRAPRPAPQNTGMEPVFRPGDVFTQQRDPVTGSIKRFVVPAPNPANPQSAPKKGGFPVAEGDEVV